ncbi:MAG: NTP transferase domain-containing protein [Gammaproteobacteria bacterium]|nr:NTP transferase domain-containing protein [Gammaproteobacteria bacterium]MCP5139209.1 NTP transferase domain-containing protein [Chromatiales bacterium]
MEPGGEPPPLRGLVLAGGRSVRMGRDKAGILIEGTTLLERTVALLDGCVTSVRVSVRADQVDDQLRRQFPLLPDAGTGLGPVNGLRAAHLEDPAAAWLVLACDMPGLDRRVIEALVAARDPARAATSWRSPVTGLPEPLCAIWEPATLARLASLVAAAGRPVSPRAVLAESDTLLLDAPWPVALLNLNTPAELDRYRKERHGHQPQEEPDDT